MENTLPMLLLVFVAAICDLQSGRIPNPLILAGVTFGLGFAFFNNGTEGLLMAFAGFGLGFILEPRACLRPSQVSAWDLSCYYQATCSASPAPAM
ncbi:MAG: prepilin peptidase [Candidatus Thiodiazotropha sp.]